MALERLAHQVTRDGFVGVKGFDLSVPLFDSYLDKSYSEGRLSGAHYGFVKDLVHMGSDFGVIHDKRNGRRQFRNYPSALNNPLGVHTAVQLRVDRGKTLRIGPYHRSQLCNLPPDSLIFPLGAITKPHQPDVWRLISDHTKSGMRDCCDMSLFKFGLRSEENISKELKRGYYMRMMDVEDAFPIMPYRPTIWKYFFFVWYDVNIPLAEQSEPNTLYCNIFADFGWAPVPGGFFIFLDVAIDFARMEGVLKSPLVVHVDDLALIGPDNTLVDSEGVELEVFMNTLGIFFKTIKVRMAALLQLAIGFWWDSVSRTLTLEDKKQKIYLEQLDALVTQRVFTLRELQQIAGRGYRICRTLPLGANVLLANIYAMTRGLKYPHHKRRGTKALRDDLASLASFLRLNHGKGYFSLDDFERAPDVETDACKSRRFAGGGYFSYCGRYNFWSYGSASRRRLIDEIEGDTAYVAALELGHLWAGKVVNFWVDNSAFQLSGLKGWSRVERLNSILRKVLHLCVQGNFVIIWNWISTHDNIRADALSRDNESDFLNEGCDGISFARESLCRHPDAGSQRSIG